MKRIIRIVRYAGPLYLAIGGGLFIYVDLFVSNIPQGPYWRAPSLLLTVALLVFINTRFKSNHELIYYTYLCYLFSLSLMISGLLWSTFSSVPLARSFSALTVAVFIVYISSSGGYKLLLLLYLPMLLLPLAIMITYQVGIASMIQYSNVYSLIIPCLIASQVDENLRFKEFSNRKIAEYERNNANKAYQELASTQAQLIQKEKLASLGELTAGIAHEIQNPLNFVNNFAELSAELVEELKDETQAGRTDEVLTITDILTENLRMIHHHGVRASGIVRGMLDHSRTGSGEKRPTDLNALVNEYLTIAYQGIRANNNGFSCQIVKQLDATVGQVVVTPQELGRVLLNLYSNAFYAVSKQAQQGDDPVYKPEIVVSTQRQAGAVLIEVQDNGMGMAESVKAKIFQPFFTTKPPGEGTGLGLSLSYDIVTRGHGGSLLVNSQVGSGSIFTIQLPQ
ncbi:sensor histidine kinase [Spirosoma rhododendri]|uniref:histidine kinase n=1 Tax=Spirosoma rhododendri TaxID=2728024 RepID=A0A7L5DQU9_9BACT|nr:ATP-binding protein [Spirosoma rhododendri]QJD79603.1 two-component sensor histidine kinase [Spirosoma rhododendri]